MNVPDNEFHIGKLRDDIEAEYQYELRRLTDERAGVREQTLAEADAEVFDSLGIDPKPLEDLHRTRSEASRERNAMRRQELIERESTTRRGDLRVFSAHLGQATHVRPATTVMPFAADLRAPDESYIIGDDGTLASLGEYVVFQPNDPSWIRLKVSDEGEGWGWPPETPSIVEYTVWYQFIPLETCLHEMWTYIGLKGFLMTAAHDEWYTTKSANVRGESLLTVYQGSYSTSDERTLFNQTSRKGVRVHDYPIYPPSGHFLTAALVKDVLGLVILRVRFIAFAEGDGSYAEINFADRDYDRFQPYPLTIICP